MNSVNPSAPSDVDLKRAYNAASNFIEWLGTLANCARHSDVDKPTDWESHAGTYATAFLSWHALNHELLTPAVREAARRVHAPTAPLVKLGRLPAKPTVIEAICDELGVYFRNVLYQDRRCPLDPDYCMVANQAKAKATAEQVALGKPAEPFGWGRFFDELMVHETPAAVRARLGIKNHRDAFMLMANEWKEQDKSLVGFKLRMLQLDSLDFDALKSQLARECAAVLSPKSNGATSPVGGEQLAQLLSAIQGLAGLSGNRHSDDPDHPTYWKPPEGFIGSKQIHAQYNVPPSTQHDWRRDYPPEKVIPDPRSGELYVPLEWIEERKKTHHRGKTTPIRKRRPPK